MNYNIIIKLKLKIYHYKKILKQSLMCHLLYTMAKKILFGKCWVGSIVSKPGHLALIAFSPPYQKLEEKSRQLYSVISITKQEKLSKIQKIQNACQRKCW